MNCCPPPTTVVGLLGVTVIETGEITVSVAVPWMPDGRAVAVTVVEPEVRAVTSPVVLTVATLVPVDNQEAEEVMFCCAPLLQMAVA